MDLGGGGGFRIATPQTVRVTIINYSITDVLSHANSGSGGQLARGFVLGGILIKWAWPNLFARISICTYFLDPPLILLIMGMQYVATVCTRGMGDNDIHGL